VKNPINDNRTELITAEMINNITLLSDNAAPTPINNPGNDAINDNAIIIMINTITNRTYFKDNRLMIFLNSKNPLNPTFAKFTDAK